MRHIVIAFTVALLMGAQSVTIDPQTGGICVGADGTTTHDTETEALETCINRSMAAPDAVFDVFGSRYRVTSTGTDQPCPFDPSIPASSHECVEPEPEPPPEPDFDYGPVTQPTRFESDSRMARNSGVWRVVATTNALGERQGLVSRDQSGTTQPGHFTLRIEPDGRLYARNQGSDNASTILRSRALEANREYVIEVSFGFRGMALFVDGAMADHDPQSFGTNGNQLPLWLGASCVSCTAASNNDNHKDPLNGTVSLDILEDEAVYDPPQPVTHSMTMRWTHPSANTDGSAYTNPRLTQVSWSGSKSGSRNVAHPTSRTTIDGFETGDVVTAVARSCNDDGVCSADSNRVRKEF